MLDEGHSHGARRSIWIDASPETVWEVVANVDNLGRYSPETNRTEWLDASRRHQVGARFRGHNSNDHHAWHTDCTITEFTEPSAFAFDVSPGPDGRFATRWRYTLAPDGTGTHLTESFDSPILEDRPAEMNPDRHQTLSAMLTATLHAIKEDIESDRWP